MGARNGVSDFKWIMKRLKAMAPAEIFYRVGEQCALKAMQVQYRIDSRISRRSSRPPNKESSARNFEFCDAKTPQLPALPWKAPTDPRYFDDLIAGKLKFGAFTWQWRPENQVWHRAPDTGRLWPRTFFGSIPYRPGNPYGDVRLIWEPSRLQQLAELAHFAAERPEETRRRAVGMIEAQFLSWIEMNPRLSGVHYISTMECALRLLSVCHALDLVRGQLECPQRIWPALVELVESHAKLIEKRLSLHSSAGNHTLAEAAGLVYAGILFPEMPRAGQWRATGCSLLEKEADRQVLSDGGGAEQAFGYLRFAIDLFGLVVRLLEHRKEPVPGALREVNGQGRRFLNGMADHTGRVPPVGDSDDGNALSPNLRLWFLRRESQDGFTSCDKAGYSVMRSDRSLVLFDHGALGMPPLCGHGHADALSILLRIGKRDFLIDPGTFSYADPTWRSYFRGTAAHNTVTVDGQDQAVQETPFSWSYSFQARRARHQNMQDGGARLLAFHTGYKRLGVTHWRGLLFRPPGYWLIWDILTGGGKHRLDLHWHLGLPPVQEGSAYFLTDTGERVLLSIEGGEVSSHRGEIDPILGWRSPAYGTKEPATTLRARYQGTLPHTFLTRFTVGPASPSDLVDRADLAPFMDGVL